MGQSRFLLAAFATIAAACGRIDFTPIPPDAAIAAPARAIAVSYVHACGIDGTGHLLCWGADHAGELGDGNSTDFEKPVQVMSGTWREVATGGIDPNQAFTCAIRDDGTLWCFGENFDGELGIGSTAVISTPVQVGADPWQQVATGTDCNACAIRDDGSVWCWGSDTGTCGGSVGDGGAVDVLAPVEVASGSWLEVSVGYGESCAIRADHTLWCWGYGGYYDFGNNDQSDLTLPTQIGTDTSWSHVSMGSRRGCGQRDDGSLWCWGANSAGEVGDGTTTIVMSAEVIAPGMTWSAVAVGDAYTCAIDAAGSLWCWGDPTYGVFGVDLSADATTPREIEPRLVGGPESRLARPPRAGFTTGSSSAPGKISTQCSATVAMPTRSLQPWILVGSRSQAASTTCAGCVSTAPCGVGATPATATSARITTTRFPSRSRPGPGLLR